MKKIIFVLLIILIAPIIFSCIGNTKTVRPGGVDSKYAGVYSYTKEEDKNFEECKVTVNENGSFKIYLDVRINTAGSGSSVKDSASFTITNDRIKGSGNTYTFDKEISLTVISFKSDGGKITFNDDGSLTLAFNNNNTFTLQKIS